MKKTFLLPICLMCLLAGCSAKPGTAADGQAWQDSWEMAGTRVGVEAPAQLTLQEKNEALAADGMYYTTWVTGDSVPYENSDGETIDLYDAQLYLLTSEALTEEKAGSSCESWLAAAKMNYEVISEDSVEQNGQTYTRIHYRCVSEDSPYDHGVSAFGVCGSTAVCAELTCRENYTGDLDTLLTEFLNGCHYPAE